MDMGLKKGGFGLVRVSGVREKEVEELWLGQGLFWWLCRVN